MSHHINKVRIKAVAKALKELNEYVVYIGGAAISLYAEEVDLPDHRTTDDIDVIIELKSYGHYEQIRNKLVALGFREDVLSGVICRWTIQGIILDIMPLDDKLWGFSNAWYKKAFEYRVKTTLDGQEIQILPLHLLVLTKWEALIKRQGGIDWRWSHDFEDIIKLLIATDEWHNIKDNELKYAVDFINVLQLLIEDEALFYEACRAQLSPNFYSDEQIYLLLENIKKFK